MCHGLAPSVDHLAPTVLLGVRAGALRFCAGAHTAKRVCTGACSKPDQQYVSYVERKVKRACMLLVFKSTL